MTVVQSLIAHNMIVCTHSSEPLGHLYAGKGDITPQLLYPFYCRFSGIEISLRPLGGRTAFLFFDA